MVHLKDNDNCLDIHFLKITEEYTDGSAKCICPLNQRILSLHLEFTPRSVY